MQSWDSGHHSALRTQEPQGQAPSLPSWWFKGLKQPTPSSLLVKDNSHWAGATGATGWGRYVCKFLGWHREYILFPDLLLQSVLLPNLYHCSCYRKKITKRFTWALCCWEGQIFSHQFLVVSECPTPLLGRDLSLPSKSCRYCSPDRRCFKTLSWGQTMFTNHQGKQLLNGRGDL